MKQYKTSADLKGLAKTHMFGHYGSAVGAYVWMNLFLTSINLMVSTILPNGTLGDVLSGLFYLVNFLLIGVFTAGETYLYLNIACGRPVRANFIFYGFKNQTDKALLIQAIIMGLEIAVSLPLILFVAIYMVTKNTYMYIFIGIGGLISLAGIILVTLVFMPAFYLMHDFPQYSAKQILEMCRKLMSGNMGRLFKLYVSFIPIQLLELLSLGIGALWVEPYRSATLTEFFLNLMKPDTTEA